MDDTNPIKEDDEFVEAIKTDVKWLGYDWQDRMYYASDYFNKLYEYAVQLIKAGKAYVCELTPEQIREYRGTLTEPGKDSPYRNRLPEENLALFEKMRLGAFPVGSRVLRAKIDMSSGNLNMRDPIIYRIMNVSHHRTGDKWCIYPMYDFAHPLSDAIESITHSICTLEFADHRPLYDWLVENVDYSQEAEGRPNQYEFARLNLSYTVMSKRKLKVLVEEGIVSGWDDPRMPTISGLRRRGYTPASIRDFCERIGVAKATSLVDKALLEHCIREDLNQHATRVMAVLRPLKVILLNYPEAQDELLEIDNNPEQEGTGKRKVPFAREIYIEQDDFMEEPPNKFFRLAPGKEVRLKGAYIIKCEDVIKNDAGEIVELHCTYDPDTRSGLPGSARKVKGVLHWVSAKHAKTAEIRLYNDLFIKEQPDNDEGADFQDNINPNSLEVIEKCMVEPSLGDATIDDRFQFMRQGYFCMDTVDSATDKLVFNRIVSLKDSWSKAKK
jgi:glutaminyl-tRNA synthetase